MRKLTMAKIKSDALKKRAKMLKEFKRMGWPVKEYALWCGVSESYIRSELVKARRDVW